MQIQLNKAIEILKEEFNPIVIYLFGSGTNGEISHKESTKIVDLVKDSEAKLQDNAGDKTTNADKNTINVQQAKADNLDFIIRKNAHGFMYMILAFLVSSVFFEFNKRGKDIIVYILFICLFYALTDEFHQSFVPGRAALVSDVLVDFGGVLIGLTFFYLVYYKIYTYKKSAKRNQELITYKKSAKHN